MRKGETTPKSNHGSPFGSSSRIATSGPQGSYNSKEKKNKMEGLLPPVKRKPSDFFNTELEWPNSKPSGITPAMYTTRPNFKGVVTNSGVNEEHPLSFCEKTLNPKKPPRPESLPWNVLTIRSDPPTVDIDDVEEFLVHDALFVEFFNAFLALPAFPEPICFNLETGGFEVVSDGRHKLAKQIKEAVRSQNFTPKMYRLARQHAFSDMPLIPIEDSEGPEGVKIDTTYDVTVLNKDQGIYWIKAERLPIFLESDFYFEYRLAKVVSQAGLFNDNKDYVVMKIDFTPRQKKVKKSVEVPPPNVEDIIVKQMYVSFGYVKGDVKESWFTQAKEGISTTPTFTTLSPQMSSDVSKSDVRKEPPKDTEQKRPKSSVFRSPYFGVYAPGLVGPGASEPPIQDEDILKDEMFHKVEDRPFTPRPSDKFHASTSRARRSTNTSERMVKPGKVVYKLPKQDNQNTDSESGIGDMDDKDEELERRMQMQGIIDNIYSDESWEVAPSIALNSIGEFGSVIVGAVLKKTLADVLSVTDKVILQDPKICSIYPSQELTCITVDDLDKCYVLHDRNDSDEDISPVQSSKPATGKNTGASGKTGKEELTGKNPDSQSKGHRARWTRDINKAADEESDADSLLDSDEDFEEQDLHFRRKKDKWYNLKSMKGIYNFKKFLCGTPGEKYWELWVDIDKARVIHDEEEEQRYSTFMRAKYHKHGSPFELSSEDKIKLGLESPTQWIPDYLFQIQGKVVEPLVLYWAPRYLLKHMLQTDPDKYYMYSAMKACQPPKESDPHPMTKSLLPLGPKSCCPRSNPGQGLEERNAHKDKTNLFESSEPEFVTRPKTGNRRIYGEDTWKRLARTPTAKFLGIQAPPEEQPKIIVNQTRPHTASSAASFRSRTSVRSVRSVRLDSAKSKDSSLSSSSEQKVKDKSKIKQSSSDTPDRFVGKLPGIGSKARMTASARASNTNDLGYKERCRCKSAAAATKPVAVVDDTRHPSEVMERLPCPSRNLNVILGEERTSDGEPLGPVKKPRDLLSPKLRILDTKQQRSRQASAPHRTESKEQEKATFYRQDSIESSKASKACDSRPTSGTKDEMRPVKVADMTDCDFMGSERMEMLLQALHHEKEAGRAFRKFMEKDDENQVALNCFDFWESVQDYRKLFYKDKLDLFFINKQAKVIFAQFIVRGSPKSIEVSDGIELQIMDQLKPAYEDLYDEAEEHALKVLFGEFLEFLSQDIKTYCKVERSEISRRLETRNTYILNLQKKGIIKEGPLTPDDPMEGYVDPVCDDSVLERIPEEFRDWTFDKLVHNRLELEQFRQYLAENYAEIDLKCWMDMEAWRRTPPTDTRKRDQRAKDIKKLYLNKKYFFGPSSPAGKEGQDKVMEAAGGWGKFLEDKPHHDAILEAQHYVAERLEKKHLPWFLLTKEFQERQAPKITPDDIADDVVVQKKRRSQAVLKVREIRAKVDQFGFDIFKLVPRVQDLPVDNLFPYVEETPEPSIEEEGSGEPESVESDASSESQIELEIESISPRVLTLLESKWVSSTKEIYIFKQALRNPVTCKQFQKYVSIRGDNLENDLLFWLEVQRYKQMHHMHTEDSMLLRKINAIIQCFIDSNIPPSLQIDIPQDMAERVMDHKHEKGPYLFRESQLATFRILLTHWIPFCEFRNNMGSDERALKTLERHRLAAQLREQRYQEELEREKLRALEDVDQLPDELKDDEDEKGKIAFSYSNYLSQEAQTIRSVLDKSVDTASKLGSDEKLSPKDDKPSIEEEEAVIDRRLSSVSERRRMSELSGISKRKSISPEERQEEVNQFLTVKA